MVMVRQCNAVEGTPEGAGCEDDFVDVWQDSEFLNRRLGINSGS